MTEIQGQTPPDIDDLIRDGLSNLDEDGALEQIAWLVDLSADLNRADGTARAFHLLDELVARQPACSDVALATIHYFRANAWHNRLRENGTLQAWGWEQPDLQEEILELRRAVRHPGFPLLARARQWQIRTNLAGKLSIVGRVIEAIEQWDIVLADQPKFAKAAGNRGQGLIAYAKAIEDGGHAAALLSEAHHSLEAATAKGAIHELDVDEVAPSYEANKRDIENAMDVAAVRAGLDLDVFSLGASPEEQAYRLWCLQERLFINPLNDLGPHSIAATDAMNLPTITDRSRSALPPPIIGFFNQIKQEFVSARFMLYEGLHSTHQHFSDRDVTLFNTLDYPAYGLATERLRMAFRSAYSVLDKVAFFLNAYLDLGHKPQRVSFRSVWCENADRAKPLLQRFEAHPNLPMRGLFWLSKDFFEEDFTAVTEPDAEALATMRNHLEHRYLQLHDMGEGENDAESAQPGLRYSLARTAFQSRALRLFCYSRAALIYLSMAVRCEETIRGHAQAGGLTMPMLLDRWEDDWKS